MNEQMGWKALKRNLEKEVPDWANILPSLPRSINTALNNMNSNNLVNFHKHKIKKLEITNVILLSAILVLAFFYLNK